MSSAPAIRQHDVERAGDRGQRCSQLVRHDLSKLRTAPRDVRGVSEVAQDDARAHELAAVAQRRHHRVQQALADPDLFANRLTVERAGRELERIEPDGILQVRGVDVRVGWNSQHLAGGGVDEHLSRARVGDDGAIRHRAHRMPKEVDRRGGHLLAIIPKSGSKHRAARGEAV
jgi:hypothetical protein